MRMTCPIGTALQQPKRKRALKRFPFCTDEDHFQCCSKQRSPGARKTKSVAKWWQPDMLPSSLIYPLQVNGIFEYAPQLAVCTRPVETSSSSQLLLVYFDQGPSFSQNTHTHTHQGRSLLTEKKSVKGKNKADDNKDDDVNRTEKPLCLYSAA